ncbi:MAG: galactitol-1-phosphate 5-dehydrogenase [Anaerohalosphaeraceae bacterium]
MKALVLTKASYFEIQDCPTPQTGDQDVLVQVRACGICGSDVHGMDGSTGRRQPPIIMGHEAAGVIADIGTRVTGWHKGERVTFDSTVYCGQCYFCQKGQINLCDHRRVLGVSCNEYRRDGAFAEFVAVPQHILYRLPDGVSYEQGAMTEALSIAVHAVSRAALSGGETVVVVGAGMIGLLVIQVLRARGCRQIIAVDVDAERLKMAGDFGADVVFNPDTANVAEQCMQLTEGRGADAAFEVVGITPAIRTAMGVLRKDGRLVMVGNLSPQVEIPLQALVTREISVYGSCASCGEYPVCLDMIANRKVDVDKFISAVAGLEEGPAWFKRLAGREAGLMKVILKPTA